MGGAKSPKEKKPRKNHKKRIAVIAIMAAVLAGFSAWVYFYCAETGNPLKSVMGILSPTVEETPPPTQNPCGIKIYSPQSPAVAYDALSPKVLSSSGSVNPEAALSLYDGDPSTRITKAGGSVTLDAGSLKALSYIGYTPDTSSQEAADSCVGTKFSASKDNKSFVELGTINPDVNGDLNPERHTILFSGYGLYRYFKVDFSPGASLGEVEWMCDDGIVCSEEKNRAETKTATSFNLTAFDATAEFDGRIFMAVYSRDNIIKHCEVRDYAFTPSGFYDLKFEKLSLENGDRVMISGYDTKTMNGILPTPLRYEYTEASSSLSMANIYSDNMMFQADTDLIISGKAPSGARVKAEIENNDTGELYAGSDVSENLSDWEIDFGAFPNGGRYTMRVFCGDEKLEFENITFGDVWVFAGQSNMEFYLCGEDEEAKYLKTAQGQKEAENSNIRMVNLYNIGLTGAAGEVENVPLNDWNDYWAELTPDRANYLSAIAYYFAQGIYERYGRNVGIISVAVGDTEINKWYPYGESFGTFTGTDGCLYNNRIYPFTKQKIKGILWYQGEADMYRTNMKADLYADAMAGLIDSYRKKWGDSELPFYYAQLARYGVKDESEIREGQRVALQRVKNTENVGMISLLDIIGTYEQGDGCARTDIHPWQKRVVAERFLSRVGHDLYGDTSLHSGGPVYKSMEVFDDRIELTFRHTGSLKVMDKSQYADSVCEKKISDSMTDTSELKEFYISDREGKFYPASAKIENDKVTVYSDSVMYPKNVMYAWGAYPEMPNLTDDTGLPAATFNTANGSEISADNTLGLDGEYVDEGE